jgi:hypothetical protein
MTCFSVHGPFSFRNGGNQGQFDARGLPLSDCPLCVQALPRKGQYRKESLVRTLGQDVRFPDLLTLVSISREKLAGNLACGIHYPDLG